MPGERLESSCRVACSRLSDAVGGCRHLRCDFGGRLQGGDFKSTSLSRVSGFRGRITTDHAPLRNARPGQPLADYLVLHTVSMRSLRSEAHTFDDFVQAFQDGPLLPLPNPLRMLVRTKHLHSFRYGLSRAWLIHYRGWFIWATRKSGSLLRRLHVAGLCGERGCESATVMTDAIYTGAACKHFARETVPGCQTFEVTSTSRDQLLRLL